MLKGKDNRSGVTIGVGVDLGQQAPEAYKDRLRNFGIKQELIAKLEPYMGLIRGQAIEKLKEKPLSLSKQEVEQIVAEMKNEMLKDLIEKYDTLTKDIKGHRQFTKLAIEEQTILFSRKWQNGSLRPAASRSIARSFSLGLVRDALDKLVPEARRDIWCKFVEIFIHFSICTLCKGIASAAKATGLTEVGIVFSAVR